MDMPAATISKKRWDHSDTFLAWGTKQSARSQEFPGSTVLTELVTAPWLTNQPKKMRRRKINGQPNTNCAMCRRCLHAGGISHLRKIANLAETYQVRTGSHGATDLSPVCMGAALHFDLSVHNFGIQEYMPHTPETDRVFPHAYTLKDGFMHPGEATGIGVDLDE